ncbi:MAG: T9SS type A sorting domain-containing protein [Bacteroidales bacterium]|nr:T9SS type A sorting domain-containing protein [Bacteroidales bacterium]
MTRSIIISLVFSIMSLMSYSQIWQKEILEESTYFNQLQSQGSIDRLTPDTTIDIKFYHLDVEISIDSAYIRGNVHGVFNPKVSNLSNFTLDLDSALRIDSITGDISSFYTLGNKIHISLDDQYSPADQVNYTIYYQGKPVMPGGFKGLRYETHGDNEPIIATLSTPFLAHSWWPCNDGPSDKADSVFIDITIKDTLVNEIQLQAISNGLLKETEQLDGKKKFKWKHRYPIVPYYVMVAISNYVEFSETYVGAEGESFPLTYYVFEDHLYDAQQGVAQLPDVIDFFSSVFGPYPFANEKYGMTQLGFYGAIENQTNTITNNMSLGWFDVSVHELAHMWFADMITCENWHHGWLNEGFATYAESLWLEHSAGTQAYFSDLSTTKYTQTGTIFIEDDTNPFEIFIPIIYNKGSWVLHMLRGVVGDNIFFQILKEYATSSQFKYKQATTEDFQEVCEQISGEDLDYFFEQWIYDHRYPKYRYNYNQADDGQIGLTIKQTQSILGWRPVFTMPIKVHIGYTDNSIDTVTVFNNQELQTWYFDSEKELAFIDVDPQEWILCSATHDPLLPVNIKEQSQTEITIFPNPAHNLLKIVMEKEYSNSVCFEILDLSGKREYSGAIQSGINISNLKGGVYIFRVIDKHVVIHQSKLVKL